jgi:hypothetical protein
MPTTYNVNPATQSGSGTYGAVAGATDIPDVYGQLSDVYPDLGATNQATSQALLAKLQGQLSPTTVNAIQDASARFGVSSGMPGAGLQRNLSLRDIGLTSEQQQQQGLQDYGNILSAVSNTQTVKPETQIATSQANAALAAQPNPEDATNYALDLYNKYLDKINPSSATSTANDLLTQLVSRLPGSRGTTTIGGPTGGNRGGGGGSIQPTAAQPSSPWANIMSGGGGNQTLTASGGGGAGTSDYTDLFGNLGGTGVVAGQQPTSRGFMYMGDQAGLDQATGAGGGQISAEEEQQMWQDLGGV